MWLLFVINNVCCIPVKKSNVPQTTILYLCFCKSYCIYPSPSIYPLIKWWINCLGTWYSDGNVKIRDFLGTHPNLIKFCLTAALEKEEQ